MKFVSLYIVSCFLSIRISGISSKKYYHGLIKYLKEESKLHQVMFIRDNELNNTDQLVNDLMKAINTNFPSLSITYNKIEHPYWKRGKINLFYKPRRTTLFVLHCKNNECIKLIADFINFNTYEYSGFPQPRYLIVRSFPSSTEELNRTLHSYWKIFKTLDVTLLSQEQQGQMMISGSHQNQVPRLSNINPFTREFFVEKVSPKSQWFPNKLRDLNGYKLTFSYPPLTSKLNNGTKFAQLLADVMKAKCEIFVNDLRMVSSDLFLHLRKGTEHPSMMIPDVYYSLRILSIENYKFVVPKTFKYSSGMSVSREFWFMLFGTIGMICVIRLTAFFSKFDKSTWQTLNISQIIMGMPTTPEPRQPIGRIIFGSLLITCIVYSGYFYSVILDISWTTEPEISNLEELAQSNLTTMVNPYISYLLTFSSLTHIRQLGNRSIGSHSYTLESDCWRFLVDHQNVSCLLTTDEYNNKVYREKNKPNVKMLSEAALHYTTTWNVGNSLPYLDRFNEIILKAWEFGLLRDFFPPQVQLRKILELEKIEKDELFFILTYVLTIGYSVSTIVFLLEIVSMKFQHRMCAFYTRFQFANGCN